MGDVLFVVVAVAILSAIAGKNLARKKGHNPIVGLVIGGVLPFVGLGLLKLLKEKRYSRG